MDRYKKIMANIVESEMKELDKKSTIWNTEVRGKEYVRFNDVSKHKTSDDDDEELGRGEFNVVDHSSLPYDNREVDMRFTPNKFSSMVADVETPNGIPDDIDEYSNSQVPGADGDMHYMPNWEDQEHSISPNDRMTPILEDLTHSTLPNDSMETRRNMASNKKAYKVLDEKEIKQLSKLSGMASRSGYYSSEEWKDKTGVDPQPFINMGLIKLSKHGACLWTKEAENYMRDINESTRRNWRSIGVNASKNLSKQIEKLRKSIDFIENKIEKLDMEKEKIMEEYDVKIRELEETKYQVGQKLIKLHEENQWENLPPEIKKRKQQESDEEMRRIIQEIENS